MAAKIATEFPSRLREGLGEGRPTSTPREKPLPRPLPQAEGEQKGKFAQPSSPANASAQTHPNSTTPAEAGAQLGERR